ncbi:M28 family peptidase [Parasegetibacter sp. NRK P23]|uniref:M28 family peptidase n=1 Tax=Parasegetibacter sp. NRK P23 TaxID=2942999 RepID=UPI002044356E|nr:M28 family peptidase [Parasegetibacter sp. NRK P23]MCM5530116.1 M20/M25/M40 family metallo-hydrolase [Parasegetibacter sp. NRK P23]
MRKIGGLVLALIVSTTAASAQQLEKVINIKEVTRIESILAADDMEGRRTFTPGIDKAAAFIAEEFKKAGLKPVSGNSFLQSFSMVRPDIRNINASLNGNAFAEENIILLSVEKKIDIKLPGSYKIINISKEDDFRAKGLPLLTSAEPVIVAVDPAHTSIFKRLKNYKQDRMSDAANVVFVLTSDPINTLSVSAENNTEEKPLANVVGILPGKSKPDEYVIFSGHYDHLGIGKAVNGDSIYNGANDDAAGTTAVMMLAQYFAKQKNNERSIVFAAFTAEEVGGYGSQYFSRQFNPDKVMAMFNIEMIGTDSKWGKNSAYITGYEKTDMGKILAKNLEGTDFTFHPDPYPDQDLFYRSDNATLARLGVPAHTISTSKMDSEKHYHTVEDELATLDLENMTRIIRAIALSSRSIIAGKDTPSRVDSGSLR